MPTLNLTLRGLCGLVPNEFVPSDRPHPGHRTRHMRVLVLDAADLGRRIGQTLCTHRPRLIIGSGGNARIIQLRRHDLRIEGLDTGAIRFQRAFWDLAHMNQVTPEPFNVDNGFLQQQPRAGVVASLRVTGGEVGSFDRMDLEFRNQTGYRKRFARAVRLRLRLNGQSKIHLTRFDGSVDPRSPIDLIPDAADTVEMTLTNACDDAQQDDALQDDASEISLGGADFAAYYGLLPAYDGPLFVPVEPGSSMASPLVRYEKRARGKKRVRREKRALHEVRAEASGPQTGCVPVVYNANSNA